MKTSHILKIKNNYLLALHKGDKIQESIKQFCQKNNITSASYTGLGAATNLEVAQYNPTTKSYDNKMFNGAYEVTSFVGNVAQVNNGDDNDDLFIHSHINIAQEGFQVFGGHLMEGEVLAVMEIFITSYKNKLTRKFDTITNLNILQ